MNNTNSNGYNASNGNNGHFKPIKSQMQKSSVNDTNNNNKNNSLNTQEALGKKTWDSLMKLHAQNTSNDERNAADQFLSKYLPNQPCCWQIFAKFLTTDKIPHEAHFFAANMLRSKIQRNLHEVPSDFHQGLHEMIVSTLVNFNHKGQKYENVRTQLAIGLALLAIQRTDWKDEVVTITDRLGKSETLDILLNILTRLAEELYTFHIPISPKIQQIASNNLRKHGALVLRLLHDLFKNVETKNLPNKTHIKLKVFKCFAAWLDFMDTHFKDFMKNYSVLTQFCFSSLENDLLFKEACSCISKILRLSDGDTRRYYYDEDDTDENNNNNGRSEIDALMAKQFNILVPNILNLKPMYKRAVREDDSEKCYGLTRLFVDTAEHYVDWIIQQPMQCAESRELIQMVLECSAHSDPSISTYVCLFWDRLFAPFISMAREYKRQYPHKHEIYDEFERPWPDWAKPYVWYAPQQNEVGLIPTVIPNIVKSAKLPMDFEDMDEDEQEDALQIRWQLSDVIADICQIIGLHSVFDILSQLLAQFENKSNLKTEDIYHCEAVLFCIRSTYRCEQAEQHKPHHPLYRIFTQIKYLPRHHFVIRRAAIELISTHCGYIQLALQEHKELFSFLSQYVLSGLTEASLARDSAKAILSLSRLDCADLFPHNFIRSLFTVYENKSQSYNLHTRSELTLIEAITVLISSFSSEQTICEGINTLLAKPTAHLKKLLSATPKEEDEQVSVEGVSLYHTMNCISSIFKYFRPSKNKALSYISVKYLCEMWPDIKCVLTNYTHRDGVMEKTTRIIKHVIRNGGHKYFAQCNLCIEALKLITALYCHKSQRSSFLYVIWIYVDEYIAENEDAAKQLMNTLMEITQCTFNILKQNDESFISQPDIVEDFYELLAQYIKRSPHLMIQNEEFLTQIFERAQYGLLLDQTKPHEAICEFFIDIIDSLPRANAQYLFLRFGNQIVARILRGLSGQLRHERALCLANLLNELYKFIEPQSTLQQICMQQINDANVIDVQSEDPTKIEFIQQFFSQNPKHDSRKRVRIAMDWFAACERYLRSRTF